jgi:hypothetical protein
MQLHSSNPVSLVSPQPAAVPSPAASLMACVYLALQCPHCGDVRQTLAALPATPTVLCPECGAACAFICLGKGSTTRKLPFSEVRRGQPGLLHRRDEAP